MKKTAVEKYPITSQFRMVPLGELQVDPDAQRRLSMSWVKEHTADFDVDQLGYIVVNKRPSGKYFIVDGQHRVMLMREVGWGDQKIHAECFEGLTQAQEADLFIARNDRRAVQPYDKFRVAVTAGHPDAVAIEKIVNEHGMVIAQGAGEGVIMAVSALQKVYHGAGIASDKEGPQALRNTMKTIVQAWGKTSGAVSGDVITGIGLVQLRYNGRIDQKDLATKLAPFPGGGPGLVGKGKALREMNGRPVSHCIAAIIVDQYNKGKRTGKLDAWEA